MKTLPPLPQKKDGSFDAETALKTLLNVEYGDLLRHETKTSFEFQPLSKTGARFCAGKAPLHEARVICAFETGEISFPVRLAIPSDGKKHPFFVALDFFDVMPSKSLPVEELVDNGWGVLQLFYQDVTCDADFDAPGQNAADALLSGVEPEKRCGKIRIWAWAASRALDLLQNVPEFNGNAVVTGHSRLGKTALLAAALDPRFAGAVSNDAGTAGDALYRARTETSENVEKITRRFPYWFLPSFAEYKNRDDEVPFDQHFLVASAAASVGRVLINSAFGDYWAAPTAQFASVCAAAPAVGDDFSDASFPEAPARLFRAHLGFAVRNGVHYFSREDWHAALAYFKHLL